MYHTSVSITKKHKKSRVFLLDFMYYYILTYAVFKTLKIKVVIGHASHIITSPMITYIIVFLVEVIFSSFHPDIKSVKPAYIIYITAITDRKLKRNTTTSWIYCESERSTTNPSTEPATLSIHCCKPQSPF